MFEVVQGCRRVHEGVWVCMGVCEGAGAYSKLGAWGCRQVCEGAREGAGEYMKVQEGPLGA